MIHFRSSFLIIKTSFAAQHYYKEAPEAVKFLRNPHRHVFNVSVNLPVTELDREFEFFLFKGELDQFIEERFLQLATAKNALPFSCETMANIIACWLIGVKGLEYGEVTVQEDQENAAMVALSANSPELQATQIIHFTGRPGSGKSSLANAFADSLRKLGVGVTVTEVSDCVKNLYEDCMDTPLSDPILKEFVRSLALGNSEQVPQLHFIVGAREPFLIHEDDRVIKCVCKESIRKSRYEALGKDLEAADKRARTLGLPSVKYDTLIETEGTVDQAVEELSRTLKEQARQQQEALSKKSSS